MELFEPSRVILILSGLAMVALAAALLALDFTKRANRIFAAFLGLRGLNQIFWQTTGLGDDRWARFVIDSQPYLLLPLLPLALYFVSVYPRPRGPLGGRYGGWITLAAIAAIEVLYFLKHSLYHTYAPGMPSNDLMWAHGGAGYAYTAWGPLILLPFLGPLVIAVIAFLFARDYTKSTQGTQRVSHFLVAVGFIIDATFTALQRGTELLKGLDLTGFALWPYGWAMVYIPLIGGVFAVAAVILVIGHKFGTDDEALLERRFFIVLALAAATAIIATWLGRQVIFENPSILALMGFWRLILPLGVTYALLRYSLFDIDIRVHKTLAVGVVIAIFGGVYLITSEVIENLVADRWGNRGGLLAAAGLTFVVGPLQRFGKRAATVMMPGVEMNKELAIDEGHDVYKAQYLMLAEDGQLTPKERRSLETLRSHLGIDRRTANQIEASV